MCVSKAFWSPRGAATAGTSSAKYGRESAVAWCAGEGFGDLWPMFNHRAASCERAPFCEMSSATD